MVFGGYCNGNTLKDCRRFSVKTESWDICQFSNEQKGRRDHSTTVVSKGGNSVYHANTKVFIVGGLDENENNKKFDVFEFTPIPNAAFWTLHFLRASGIQQEIGLDMIQEVIEILTERNDA